MFFWNINLLINTGGMICASDRAIVYALMLFINRMCPCIKVFCMLWLSGQFAGVDVAWGFIVNGSKTVLPSLRLPMLAIFPLLKSEVVGCWLTRSLLQYASFEAN